jgi:membrane protease YdiL (CAAX protease family)
MTASVIRRTARRGLLIYFVVVAILTTIFDVLLINVSPAWVIALMWSPAVASIIARLILHEGFADVSFRFGGSSSRMWKTIVLALFFPTIIGLIAYGSAWAFGIVEFNSQGFIATLFFATFIGIFPSALLAAGEEIGWRGYMLKRLIDAGVPYPVLTSGLIWAAWHIPLVVTGAYVAGLSPLLTCVLLSISITSLGVVIARMRLETGSIWPAIVLHGAWNSIIQNAFDPAVYGASAALWVGEAGILTASTLVIAAIISKVFIF